MILLGLLSYPCVIGPTPFVSDMKSGGCDKERMGKKPSINLPLMECDVKSEKVRLREAAERGGRIFSWR